MALAQSIETIKSKLSTIPVTTGQVIYVGDTQEIYFDSSEGIREQIKDLIILETEAERLVIIAPLQKLYYVKNTSALWIYSGAWVEINNVGALPFVQEIGKLWWENAIPLYYEIPASTHGKGQNPIVQCFNEDGEMIEAGIKIVGGNITVYSTIAMYMKVVIL